MRIKCSPRYVAPCGCLLPETTIDLNHQIIEASKAWRDAWVSILSIQVAAISIFEELYNPIIGTSDGPGHEPVETPQLQLDRTAKLKDAYAELKTDLLEEVNMMDSRVIKPATDAKDYIQPVRKSIKKRENKRLDWEKYIDRVNNYQRKPKRSDRENAALAKAEEEAARAAEVGLWQNFKPMLKLTQCRTSKSPMNIFEKRSLLSSTLRLLFYHTCLPFRS